MRTKRNRPEPSSPDDLGPVPEPVLATRHGTVDMRFRTAVMGILNVTPDSFSDGGRYADVESAVAGGVEMARQGASIVDVGGESTRPGAAPVSAAEELERVAPVIRELRRRIDVPISIDTYKEEVARGALAAGADMVNDVSALRFDPAMAGLVAREGVPVVLMHMKGRPRTMQIAPRYRDVVGEVTAFLRERVAFAVGSGIAAERIVVDPGIGFGKDLDHNLALLRSLGALASLGQPVLVGLSRKAFLGRLQDTTGTESRLAGSLAGAAAAVLAGAHMVRVHDVLETCRAVRVADAIRRPRETRQPESNSSAAAPPADSMEGSQ
ncbi:MAG: dihydropteroate synthase [Deltaproteobacteria bacterium]|nr:dihydropteroate synthase [Deltaproteobacteria bacterium]